MSKQKTAPAARFPPPQSEKLKVWMLQPIPIETPLPMGAKSLRALSRVRSASNKEETTGGLMVIIMDVRFYLLKHQLCAAGEKISKDPKAKHHLNHVHT